MSYIQSIKIKFSTPTSLQNQNKISISALTNRIHILDQGHPFEVEIDGI